MYFNRWLTLTICVSILIQPCRATDGTYCYKTFCKCFRNGHGGNSRAICSGRNLTYIPRLPNYIEVVTFERTNLSSRRTDLFYNLTFSVTKKINLTGNLIQYLDEGVFENLSRLGLLTVSDESLLDVQVLKQAFRSLRSKCCERITLSNNNWNYLPRDMFRIQGNGRIKRLILSGNKLQSVDFNSFDILQNLKELFLDNNDIKAVRLEPLSKLSYLDISRNSLPRVPRFCDAEKNSFFPMLRFLNLGANGIGSIGQTSLNCLPSLRKLNLESINTGRLQSNIFSNVPNLSILRLAKVGNPLKVIEPFAFNSSSLTKLSLEGSKFQFNGNKYNPDTIFAYCPNLEVLDLRENRLYIPGIQDKLARILKPLKNLRSLTLTSTEMSELPKNTFTNLQSLQTLNIDSNSIITWNKSNDIFGNMTSLRNLNLLRNLITLVNETSFPMHLLQSLKSLYLEGNPFSCTCEQRWFLNWTRSTKINLGSYPKFYRCAYPQNLKGVSIKDYRPTDKVCNPWNPLLTVVTTLSSVVIFIIIVTVLIIRCQGNIKNYLYFLRVYQKWKQGYLRLENDMDYEYHAFVVYCDADRNWVHKELLDKIENIEGMHLCIHHRNFDVGQAITDNVDQCLRKSWKVIVVISNSFCKSEWCQWEVDVIQGRRREKGKDAVVPIMLENIDSKHMTGKIRTLLDSTPCLTYKKAVGAALFWKTLTESLRKPLSHPPVSVL